MAKDRSGEPRGKHSHASSTQKLRPTELKKAGNPWPKRVLFGALGLLAVCVVCVAVLSVVWLRDLPQCTAEDFDTARPTEVYASDRTTVLARFQLQNRVPVDSLSDISPYVVKGTVATEDERFYSHGAIDLAGISRALINNMMGGAIEGASTITQQLVRNTALADEAADISVKRKLREAVLAVQVEGAYSKDEILLMYLNTINYGSGAYGIEAAAKRYYSKSASELTLGEAAVLIGIPQSPTYNNPIDYPEHAKSRRNVVLDRMVSNGVISEAEANKVKAEEIVLNPSEYSDDGILEYPYFTSYVRQCLLDELSYEAVFQGGLKVYTTLEVKTQEAAEKAAKQKADQAGAAFECALTAIDPDNGYIVAMVGGRDYYENQYNLAAQAGRQTGSSFKTFTLVTALSQGISPETQVDCSSYVKINDWEVHNYDYADYGITSIANMFAVSSNTGFARLVTAVTPQAVANMAHKLGIESKLNAVPSITLGSQDCSTLEMADAYATLANGGTHYDAVCIEQAFDRKGNAVIDNTNPKGERAVSAEVAHAAVEVMKGVVTGGTGTAAQLASGQEVAGKTGTTEEYLDSWFCGITPQYSVAIWLGDRTNKKAVGVTATSCFSDFLNQIIVTKSQVESFPYAKDPTYTKTFKNPDLEISGIVERSDANNNNNNNNNNANNNANNVNGNTNENSATNTNTNTDVPPTPGNENVAPGGGEGGGGDAGGDAGGGAGGGETAPEEPTAVSESDGA